MERHQLVPLIVSAAVMINLASVFGGTVKPASNKKHGILVDAGNSGSKVIKCSWEEKSGSTPNIECNRIGDKVKAGLASYQNNTGGLKAHIDKVIETAKKGIDVAQYKTTPFFIMGTSGFRFQPEDKTDKLLKEVRKLLTCANGFPFQPITDRNVRVLTGEEEAAFAWTAANYLIGSLDKNNPSASSVGVMEMGSGSTQIAFKPEGTFYAGVYKVGGKSIYAHSYDGLGLIKFKTQIAEQIHANDHSHHNQSNHNDVINNPCMLKGDSTTVILSDKHEHTVIGTSDRTQCQSIINQLLKADKSFRCQPKDCVIRQVYQPKKGDYTFYAIAAFYYTPKDLGAINKDGLLNMKKLNEESEKLCRMTMDQATKAYSVKPKYLAGYCMSSVYFPILFKHYGFDANTHNIKVSSKIEGKAIGWDLGFMLTELSRTFSGQDNQYSAVSSKR